MTLHLALEAIAPPAPAPTPPTSVAAPVGSPDGPRAPLVQEAAPPATTEPESRRRAAPTGFLSLSSEPWAQITIDGRPIGRSTPAPSIELPAGVHTVELINPVLKLRRRLSVKILANRSVTRRVVLE
jgi:hypothetical protein